MGLFNKFKKKNYLKRTDFINSVDSNKIWSKSMTLDEIKELLEHLKNEENANDIVLESVFNFWEIVGDEYFGDFISISRDLGLTAQELTRMDDEYRKKGIICVQERDVILEIIQVIKNYINERGV